MDRQIVCVAIPSFEVALTRLNDPALRTRPLAIAPLSTSRALLREVSLEAMQDGLYVGIPIEQARRLSPSLHVLSPNPHRIHRANQSPHRGHTLRTCLGTVSSWLVRHGSHRDDQAVRVCL
jgi:DNA polymerase IV